MKKIELEIDNKLISLAGEEYGEEIFNKQVKRFLIDCDVEVVFPSKVELIVSSFVYGFINSCIKAYKEEHLKICGGLDNCANQYFKLAILEMEHYNACKKYYSWY